MNNTYQIGTSQDGILLSVLVNAPGPAATNAITVNPQNEAEPGVQLGHSNDPNGEIDQLSIGKSATLTGKRLGALTKVGIPGADLQTRQQAAAQVSAKYTLTGGEAGSQSYNNPNITISDDATTVFVNFTCDFI
jgi:hypothetical protein